MMIVVPVLTLSGAVDLVRKFNIDQLEMLKGEIASHVLPAYLTFAPVYRPLMRVS